jgi:Flp pilus assembly protein TadD
MNTDEPISVSRQRYVRWIPLLLIVATGVAFGRVVSNGFGPFDDEQTIRDNPRLNPPQFTADGVLWYWNHPYMSLYAPLTYTAWGTIAQFSRVPVPGEPGTFKLSPQYFHVASLLLHVASVLLVYAILRRLLGRAWPAAAGALLYGLHPLQVEAVAWTSGLKDVLSGCLSLAAIWLYLRAVAPAGTTTTTMPADVASADAPARIDPLCYVLGLLCFALAMLAKPAAMMTPLLLAVIDLIILRRPAERIGRSLGPWLALAIPIAVIAKWAQTGEGVPFVEIWQRPIVAGASLVFYLQKLVLPTGLAFEYGWRPLPMLQKGWFYAIAVIPLALAVVLWVGRRRWPWLGAAGLIFVAALLPVLGFVPFMYQVHSTVGDHYVYVAMLGPALALAWALGRVDPRRWTSAAAGVGVILMLLGALSFAQLGHWRDEEVVLQRTLAINPCSALAQNAMGQVYARRGDFAAAEKAFRTSAECNPDFIPALFNLVRIYGFLDRPDDAIKAFYELRRANAGLPKDARAEYSTDIFLKAGQNAARNGQFGQAVRYFEEAVRANPDDPRPKAALDQASAIVRARAATQPAPGPIPR